MRNLKIEGEIPGNIGEHKKYVLKLERKWSAIVQEIKNYFTSWVRIAERRDRLRTG